MKFSTQLAPMKPHTSETLASERKRANFSISDMDSFINGQKAVDQREKMLAIIRSQPEEFDNYDTYYLNRTEKLEKGLKLEKKLIGMLRRKEINEAEMNKIFFLLDTQTTFDLTRGMFIPTLEQQCNDEQREAFLKPALDYRIIGCYAQTELGHGSNIRALETTATFIEETDEFEINSPTLTSTKWWIGTLGVSCSHAAVMSQVYVKGKHIGLYPVIVPIRSMTDYKPLPGINVGDIGPKMGLNTMDNGFLNLNKVRVPRFNLLQKYVNVSRDGNVTIPQNINSRASYGTMVLVRANIASNMGAQLAKAITIAVRYTSVRRQFGEPGKPETPVLDYPIVQYRVIPILAKTYAMIAMSHEFFAQYEKTAKAISVGDFSSLKEMHAVSCGLKRWTSDTAIYSVDTCRHVCGGHGFSMFSGLNEFFGNIYPNIIWEGDNYVLARQTAMYLVKAAHELRSKKIVESNDSTNLIRKFMNLENKYTAKQLFSWTSRSAQEISSSQNLLLDLLGYKFIALVHNLAVKIHLKGQTWDESSIASQGIATAHSEYIVCLYFSRHISTLPQNSPLRSIITTLFSITALSFLTKDTADLYSFVNDAAMTRNQIKGLESEYIRLIKVARNVAVPLVDALGVPDEKLNSSLGRYDGNVYEDYIKRALQEPLNRDKSGDQIRERFYKNYIEPVLKNKQTNLAQTPKL
ncbi:Peroxisomal acyl-coenzyme A oxidase 1 [Smittium culicis]|uniref:Acyl-coenzyme A oxidase n=1 Tax=Smittium culicis TaxID=133412 RepID=A0A1R1YQU9_9FUNG|nr:Peroxisomal acyl-coenzyme A oxidase 1 [Smittium culicis]